MKKPIIWGILFLLITKLTTYSQERHIPPSPTVYQLEQYTNIPVSKSTGIPNIDIPLYTIQARNLKIPVSLSYHSKGVKVTDYSSWVGMGWSLNAGGMITRRIMSAPDDVKRLLDKDFDPRHAFGLGYHSDCWDFELFDNAGNLYDNNRIDYWCNNYVKNSFSEDLFLPYYHYNIKNSYIDSSPDIFTFNFNGYTGKFIIDHDGEVRCIPKNNYKIQYERTNNEEITGFEITVDDGTVYIFDKVERTTLHISESDAWDNFPEPSYSGNVLDFNPNDICVYSLVQDETLIEELFDIAYNSTWYLSAIKDHAGNPLVQFNYENETIAMKSSMRVSGTFESDAPSGYKVSWDDHIMSYNIDWVDALRLSEIIFDDGYIKFNAHTSDREDILPEVFIDMNTSKTTNAKALNNIEIYNNDNQLYKKYTFGQSYVNAKDYSESFSINKKCEYKRLFLNSLTESDGNGNAKPPFEFTYNTLELPSRLGFEQDYWGYYNQNNATSFLPALWYYPNDPIEYPVLSHLSIYPRDNHTGEIYINSTQTNEDVADRTPDPIAMKAGILEQIVYPTGGNIQFEYEPNMYFWDNQNNIGGGLRIKKISFNPGFNSIPVIKNYYYQLSDNSSHTSGLITNIPLFGKYTYTPSDEYNDARYKFHLYSHDPFQFQSSDVYYTEVIEEIPGNGYTLFEFEFPVMHGSDYRVDYNPENGDYNYINSMVNYSYHYNTAFTYPYLVTDTLPYPPNPNYSWAGNLLKKETLYNKYDVKVKEVEFQYAFMNVEKINAFYIHTDVMSPYYLISGSKKVNKKITYHHYDNGSVVEIENFDYNTIGQLALTTREQSNQDVLKFSYKYPSDYSLSSQPTNINYEAIEQMKEKNIIQIPLETVKSLNDDVIEANVMKYKNESNYYVIDTILNLSISSPVSNYVAMDPQLSGVSRDTRMESEIIHKEYDAFGNVLKVETRDGIYAYYVWAYNNQYPIAKIVSGNNISVSITPDDNSLSKSDVLTDIQNDVSYLQTLLSSYINNNEYQVTIYTYMPLVGMTSQTDSSGLTNYYEYDDSGRLQFEKDQYGKILKKYEYHYFEN